MRRSFVLNELGDVLLVSCVDKEAGPSGEQLAHQKGSGEALSLSPSVATSALHVQLSPYTSKFTLPQGATPRKGEFLWTILASVIVQPLAHKARECAGARAKTSDPRALQNSILCRMAYRG